MELHDDTKRLNLDETLSILTNQENLDYLFRNKNFLANANSEVFNPIPEVMRRIAQEHTVLVTRNNVCGTLQAVSFICFLKTKEKFVSYLYFYGKDRNDMVSHIVYYVNYIRSVTTPKWLNYVMVLLFPQCWTPYIKSLLFNDFGVNFKPRTTIESMLLIEEDINAKLTAQQVSKL